MILPTPSSSGVMLVAGGFLIGTHAVYATGILSLRVFAQARQDPPLIELANEALKEISTEDWIGFIAGLAYLALIVTGH